mmetsp:Transcript_36909/g.101584  ORF Transcript_36909/g.101584 Transcript_36909/m.101584 type:complete len:286 (+) Transcript_36909:81-938(+)
MDRHWALFAAAGLLYALSVVEVPTAAFVAPSAVHGEVRPCLRGGSASAPGASASLPWRGGMQAASTFLALSACALASRGRAQSQRRRTQALNSVNPVLVYASALSGAAKKSGESVTVTKDVMKVKRLFVDEAFKEQLFTLINRGLDQLDTANVFCEAFAPMESTVFPKFVKYLAKKRRLTSLKLICKEYVKGLYVSEQIVPVRVQSATPLNDEQKDAIKEKMKAKTGASDIKLVCEVSGELLAGFKVEWGFVDPETLDAPADGIDMSLKSILSKAAIKEGVTTAI